MAGPGPSCACVTFTIFSVIGIIIMISVGSTVVNEYNLAKDFMPTQCTLLDMTELGFRSCEYCYTTSTSTRRAGHKTRTTKTKCRPSSFPCVRMVVSFYDRYGTNRTATFFPDAVKFTKSILCSFYVCGYSVTNNEMEVMQQVRSYQLTHKDPFPCYYSNEHRDRVIGRKIHTYSEALHGMLWPGLLTGICAIGAFVTFCGLHKSCMGEKKKDEYRGSLLQTDGNADSHSYGGIPSNPAAVPEKTPLSGPGGLPPGTPPPFDLTNPQPCPTQPYYPGGPPVYPPPAVKDFPNPEGGPAYPPPQPYPNQGPAYPGTQGPAYPPPAQPYPNQGPAYPPAQAPAYPPPVQAPVYPPPSQPYPDQAGMYPPLDQSQTAPSAPPPGYDRLQ